MEMIKKVLSKFDNEYIEDYKSSWIKAKFKNKNDLLKIVEELKNIGVKTCSTVSPTDFIDEDKIEVNYFIEDIINKKNVWLKFDLPRNLEECKIDSITPLLPSADWHELEAYSTFGVKFEGHPNLRYFLISADYYGKFPFRKDFDWKEHEKNLMGNMDNIVDEWLDEYKDNEKTLPKDGSETILHWGPTHPASGPIRLKVGVDGEDIKWVDPDIGYVWRALEHLVERKDFIGSIVAVERICFMDNPNPMICYSQAVEEIAGKEITRFAKLMRVILGEVGRTASHLISMGGFFGTAGLATFVMWTMDVREYFLDVLEEYSGARIATACVEPGGVRYPMREGWLETLEKAIKKYEDTSSEFYEIFIKNPLMKTRAVDNAKIDKEYVIKNYMAGPIARASNVKVDVRLDEPYAGYDEIDFDYVTCENGDIMDRLHIFFKELQQSMDIMKQAIAKIREGIESGEMNPQKDHLVKMPRKMPEGEAVSRIEWARGEILMHLVTKPKSSNPYRLKIKAPSVNHTMVLNDLLQGKTLSDIPLVYGSMHICQGDLDR
jgi:NADH:ubiquinone oxidoreductase subunit D/NADH:ubiquinone oxidoreductase subunit C